MTDNETTVEELMGWTRVPDTENGNGDPLWESPDGYLYESAGADHLTMWLTSWANVWEVTISGDSAGWSVAVVDDRMNTICTTEGSSMLDALRAAVAAVAP